MLQRGIGSICSGPGAGVGITTATVRRRVLVDSHQIRLLKTFVVF